MADQTWVNLLNPDNAASSGAGTALTTATTAAISPQAASNIDFAVVNAGGQYLGWKPSRLIRVTARGFITTTATGTTATWLLRANKQNGGTFVTLATTAGVATPAAANTGLPWKLEALIRCTAVAASGNTVSTQGELTIMPIAAQTILTASAEVSVGMPNASGETLAAVDTSVYQGIQLAATLAGANATIQCTQWLVEMCN